MLSPRCAAFFEYVTGPGLNGNLVSQGRQEAVCLAVFPLWWWFLEVFFSIGSSAQRPASEHVRAGVVVVALLARQVTTPSSGETEAGKEGGQL